MKSFFPRFKTGLTLYNVSKIERDGPNQVTTQQMLKGFEEQIGKIKLQQLPSDNSVQMMTSQRS